MLRRTLFVLLLSISLVGLAAAAHAYIDDDPVQQARCEYTVTVHYVGGYWATGTFDNLGDCIAFNGEMLSRHGAAYTTGCVPNDYCEVLVEDPDVRFLR